MKVFCKKNLPILCAAGAVILALIVALTIILCVKLIPNNVDDSSYLGNEEMIYEDPDNKNWTPPIK